MSQHLGKLDAELIHALSVWRVRSLSSPEQAARNVVVRVQFVGEVAALQQAGLKSIHEANGRVSGQVAMADVERLAAVPGVERLALQVDVQLALDESVPEARVPWKVPPGFAGRGAGVIIAVIDTGIDVFHESFRLPGNVSRILELWDMGATVGGNAPPVAGLGKVYTRPQIQAALVAGPDATPAFGSVDTNGHGTHVAGIAAGNGTQDDRCSGPGKYVGVAPLADLVIVRGIGVAGFNADAALTWCAQAGARNGNKPVVINCSWGNSAGPHDGTDNESVFVNNLLRPTGNPVPPLRPGFAIVVAAGNEGEGYTHESGTLAATGSAGATATVTFYMPGTSRNPDPIRIWYENAGSITLTVTAPPSTSAPGNVAGPVVPGVFPPAFPIGNMSVSVSSFSVGDANHNNKKLILVTVSTTAGNTMRSGNWTLTLTNTAAASANYDIWTQLSHDDGYPFFPLEAGDAAPARRRNNTVISPATARDAITVANYHGGEIFSSSSRGPATYPAGTPAFEMKPTLAAVGAYVTAARSRATPAPSSCCNQLVVDMNGTSMAAPHVAGVVALIFEKNRNLNFEQVRAHLQHSARKDGIPAAEVPPEVDAGHQISWNNIWGSGKLEAKIALNEVPAASAADPVRAGGGAGGAGGGTISRADVASPDRSSPDTASRDERRWPVAEELGYTPHTIFSRLGEWQRRIGPRPGLMLVASLVSEHVDEILRLINRNNKVGAVWRRHGGPLLVRHLLFGTKTQLTLLPAQVPGCDVRSLIPRFLPILRRFGSARLKADIERFGAFAQSWPGANAALLDQYAAVVAQRAIKGET